jgi:hypothetical protein
MPEQSEMGFGKDKIEKSILLMGYTQQSPWMTYVWHRTK